MRALMKGGPGAARVTREIHRRWTHMPAREMEASFRKAGVPPEVIADVKRIVGECPQCRMWVNLPPRQIAKHYRAQLFNERVWLDIFFSTV